jgi:NADPH-dependent curcumin reductase
MNHQQLILTTRPTGMAQPENFELVVTQLPELTAGEVLVQIKYISIDPAMRGWMNEGTTYIKGVAVGEVMRSFSAGVVVASKCANIAVGATVQGLLGVQSMAIVPGTMVTQVDAGKVPLSWYLGVLGMPGLTAYFGLLDKGNPKPGEVVLVNGAAGVVGSLVAQIAMIKGCQVIAIAGGAQKCSYLKNDLGCYAVIDYKADNVHEKLKEYAPNGIHVYFDNVGGDLLDTGMLHLAIGARVVICGAISQYNNASFNGLKNYMKIVSARGTISGIIVLDYFSRAKEAFTDISLWLAEGKIKYQEHVVEGIENFATALQMLFKGTNNGKLVLKID